MAMHDASHVRPLAQNRQMQTDFAGTLPLSGKLIALHIDRAQISRCHESFRNQSRRAQDCITGKAITDVAGVARGESFVVNSTADFADFLSKLINVHRGIVGRKAGIGRYACDDSSANDEASKR
jgi:hypothetical protein